MSASASSIPPVLPRPARARPWLSLGCLVGLGLAGVLDTRGHAETLPVVAGAVGAYAQAPIGSSTNVPPQIMLDISRDHQLYYKAYNDYSDLDGDGAIETTYTHGIDYYGYFDSYKCYVYTSANGRFDPVSYSARTSGAGSSPANLAAKYCASGQWSGNFLNWVSMSRMDTVRKLLYGGTRRIDTTTSTVLERSLIPTDAHSWSKFYGGADLSRLTPFTAATTPPVTTATSVNTSGVTTSPTLPVASYPSTIYLLFATGTLGTVAVGDQVQLNGTGTASATILKGYVSLVTAISATQTAIGFTVRDVGGATGTQTTSNWQLTDFTRTGVSFCNTTWAAAGTSQSLGVLNPPLLRVAQGNYALWAANEQWQCHWTEETSNQQAGFGGVFSSGNLFYYSGLNASAENPTKATQALGLGNPAGLTNTANGEYYVRVAACVGGLEGGERCNTYTTATTTTEKPIGLLQVYGQKDQILFGLLTPSYQKNVSGGVVRRDIGSITSEINADGTFATGVKGIVGTLDALRMYGYDYGSGNYITNDNCDYQLVGLVPAGTSPGPRQVTEGSCSSWGNPVGESYIESLRYLGGKTPDTRFDPGSGSRDSTLGLPQVTTWADPLNTNNYCSNLNVLVFDASVNSYDNDQTSGLTSLLGSPSAASYTNTLGSLEGINGNTWFIGQSPAGNNLLCTAKSISGLDTALGLCPEAPSLQGTYLMAGAAYYAHTNRIRSNFTSGADTYPTATDTTSLKVNTYGISLATSTPRLVIPIPGSTTGQTVVLQPAYRLDYYGNGTVVGGGAIVDFRIISQDLAAGTGKLYVNWEDSTQGGDYDQDAWGTISYAISGGAIAVTTQVVARSSANPQGFGYIVSGTSQDGPHFHSGIYNFNFTDPTNVTVRTGGATGPVANNTTFAAGGGINTSGGCVNCEVGAPPTTVRYLLANGTVGGNLNDPLWYAAKYGGFRDSNGNNKPDLVSEWDAQKADGTVGQDGLPDNYFFATNPNALESSLAKAFNQVIAKTASASAAAVVSNSVSGAGAIYQAYYETTRADGLGNQTNWIGTLQSLFLDDNGRLREDGNGDATLTDFATDPVVEIFNDPADKQTKVRRYAGDPAAGATSTTASLNSLRPVWNGRSQLSLVADATSQRAYSSLASTGRFILTSIDLNQNKTLEGSEQLPFIPGSFPTGVYGILNVPTAPTGTAQASRLVNYLRGTDNAGLRPRTIDYDGSGVARTMRLGDIASSSPTAVGAPKADFNITYNDATYRTFARQYGSRRQVVYVGANDGMLHAFNAGFYDATNKRFTTTGANSEVAHPLGSELWAYVPYNLLPQLTWLSSTDYVHVPYMDGPPITFDAQIFTPDANHPQGWGTVLVAGMRFGGGAAATTLNLPTNGANAPAFSAFSNVAANQITTRSTYVVLDITNPEAAPTVLAEINDPALGFTTSKPTLAIYGTPGNTTSTGSSSWFLAFGNGPTDLATATSTNNAGLYLYNLRTKAFVGGFAPKALGVSGSHVGDPSTVDWDLDYQTDVIYAGTVGGSAGSPSGQLVAVNTGDTSNTSAWTVSTLLNPGGPIPYAPSATVDTAGNHWVMGGTGRYYVTADRTSTAAQQLFGVIDPGTGITRNLSGLTDTTNATVYTDGTITGVTGATTQATLISLNQSNGGWRFSLPVTTSAERISAASTVSGSVLFSPVFTPGTQICTASAGTGRLLAFYYITGAARADLPTFGTGAAVVTGGATRTPVLSSISLGAGAPSEPQILILQRTLSNASGTSPGGTGTPSATNPLLCGYNAPPTGYAYSQSSEGAINAPQVRLSGDVCSGEIDWRERRNR